MRAVIIGGGRVGSYLTHSMMAAGHGVVVIEPNEERARALATATKALVVAGDGSDVRLLEEVRTGQADIVLAVTGIDEVNLVACQLAKVAFGCRRVLARVNDPENRPTFEALDVPVVSVTDLIVQVISRELALEDLIRANLVGNNQISIVEVVVPDSAPSRIVIDVDLPLSSLLVAIRRNGTLLVPGATTELLPGDRVTAITMVGQEQELESRLTGEQS